MGFGDFKRLKAKPKRAKKRYTRKRYNYKKARRMAVGNLHCFKRTKFSPNTTTTTDASGNLFIGLDYQLNDLEDHENFTRLFDSYRITGIKTTFYPITNAYTSAAQLPQIAIAADYDDSLAATNFTYMLNRAGSRVCQFNHPCQKYITPAVRTVVMDPSIVNSYGQKRKKWLDSRDPTVPHYGMKIAFQGSPSQSITYQIKTVYYLQFKQPLQRAPCPTPTPPLSSAPTSFSEPEERNC